MKIALLAPPYLPVPPKGYGGTERIVHYLAEELVKKGYEVTLFASGDSKTSAKLFSTFPKSLGNSGEIKNKPLYPLLSYVDCFSRASDFDIIHNHAQYYAMFLADLVKTPVVHTIHGSFAKGEVPEDKRMTLERFRHHFFVSISYNQRESLPDLNWVENVYNGLDISEYHFSPQKGDYLLWVGRITAKKGPVEAIKVAKKLKMKLKIAAVVDPVDRDFFTNEVLPLIDGKFIEFIGEIPEKEKRDIYSHAYCTLYPIRWHEPFGLVMVESMVCGTPVVAFEMGSVPEVVIDGKTGYIVSNIEEMVNAVKKIDKIDRKLCRKHVEEKFTLEKMVQGYEGVYKKILSKSLK
jgi:glycosyltransferase involved in cell wall biosynthesis